VEKKATTHLSRVYFSPPGTGEKVKGRGPAAKTGKPSKRDETGEVLWKKQKHLPPEEDAGKLALRILNQPTTP